MFRRIYWVMTPHLEAIVISHTVDLFLSDIATPRMPKKPLLPVLGFSGVDFPAPVTLLSALPGCESAPTLSIGSTFVPLEG